MARRIETLRMGSRKPTSIRDDVGFLLSSPGFHPKKSGRLAVSSRRIIRCVQQMPKTKKAEEVEVAPLGEPQRAKSENGGGLKGIGRTIPVLLLNAVTVLWGSQHAVMKYAVDFDHLSPDVLNFDRFLLAAIVLTPFLQSSGSSRAGSRAQRRNRERKGFELGALLAGGELGLWMFAGYSLQSFGLLTTTAGKSAFLLYLNVKIVPILSATLYGRKIPWSTWGSVALAVLGTSLLCFDGGSAPTSGDILSIGAAFCSAMFILRLSTAAKEYNTAELSVYSLWTTVMLCGSWVAFSEQPKSLQALIPSAADVPAILYLGLVTTALTTILQTFGQRYVKAEKAALIYALDPVYAAIFSYVFLSEKLGEAGIAGAFLLTFAALVSQVDTLKYISGLLSNISGRLRPEKKS